MKQGLKRMIFGGQMSTIPWNAAGLEAVMMRQWGKGKSSVVS